jgi:hypothetical protein
VILVAHQCSFDLVRSSPIFVDMACSCLICLGRLAQTRHCTPNRDMGVARFRSARGHMWDTSIFVGLPTVATILSGIGVLLMSINPNVQQAEIGRNIIVAAIALLMVIPIYLASGPDAFYPGWVIMSAIWGAVIALVEYMAIFVSDVVIEKLPHKET